VAGSDHELDEEALGTVERECVSDDPVG